MFDHSSFRLEYHTQKSNKIMAYASLVYKDVN